MTPIRAGSKGKMREDLCPELAYIVGWSDNMKDVRGKYVEVEDIYGGYDTPSGYVCRIKGGKGVYYDPDWIIPVDGDKKYKIYMKKLQEKLDKESREGYFHPELLKALAVSVFGEERVDIIQKSDLFFSYDIIIHFPEINISNSSQRHHIIKDLFVKVGLNYNEGVLSVDIRGTRSTFHLKEWMSGYTHSHLPQDAHMMWRSFCLGHSDFKQIFTRLITESNEDNWNMFFLAIEPYLSWESLEGGPYIKIESIQYPTSNVSDSEVMKEVRRLIPSIPKEVWQVSSNNISLIVTHPSLIEYIKNNCRIKSMSRMRKFNEWEEANRVMESHKNSPVKFKGKDVPYNIYVEERKTQETQEVDTEVIAYVIMRIKELSKNFTKKYEYELRKNNNKNIFEKVGTFQQTDSNHQKQSSKKD